MSKTKEQTFLKPSTGQNLYYPCFEQKWVVFESFLF